MRIQHNISALNAANQLGKNDNALSKNLQKLSSGYRINSAADDAAGLTISEKMRSQINGLNQAESNAEAGISLTQTADGALSTTQNILQRMNELATESANGTYDNDTDRANLNKELSALKDEIDTISTSTNFNKINLLDGSLSGGTTTSQVAAFTDLPTGAVGTVTAATAETDKITAQAFNTDGDTETYSIYYTDTNGKSQKLDVSITADAGTTAMTATAAGTKLATAISSSGLSDLFDVKDNADGTVSLTAKTAGVGEGKIDTAKYSLNSTDKGATTVTVASAAVDAYQTLSGASFTVGQTGQDSFTVNGQKFTYVSSTAAAEKLDKDVAYVVMGSGHTTPDATDASNMAALITQKTGLKTATTNTVDIEVFGKETTTTNSGISFQVGSDNVDDQRVSLSIGNMSSKGLGISGISIGTQSDAQAALDTLSTAINKVSGTRADIGALQNRLDYTTDNLSTSSQNLTSAESNIRDVDMSSEIVDMTKNQILAQAATSMLGQAKSLPQSVLSLLQQ